MNPETMYNSNQEVLLKALQDFDPSKFDLKKIVDCHGPIFANWLKRKRMDDNHNDMNWTQYHAMEQLKEIVALDQNPYGRLIEELLSFTNYNVDKVMINMLLSLHDNDQPLDMEIVGEIIRFLHYEDLNFNPCWILYISDLVELRPSDADQLVNLSTYLLDSLTSEDGMHS